MPLLSFETLTAVSATAEEKVENEEFSGVSASRELRKLKMDMAMSPPRERKKVSFVSIPSPVKGARGMRVFKRTKQEAQEECKEAEAKKLEKMIKKLKKKKEKLLGKKRIASADIFDDMPVEEAPSAVKEVQEAVLEPVVEPVEEEKEVEDFSLMELLNAPYDHDALSKVMKLEEPELVEPPQIRRTAATSTEFSADAKAWKDTAIGHLYMMIWKQLYCFNAAAEFKLSREGLLRSSMIVYPEGGKVINGKHYRFDEARTFEHFQRIIDKSVLKGEVLKVGEEEYLPALLQYLVIGKMYKANNLQIRMTNNPAEPAYSDFVNSRKSKAEKGDENDGQFETKRSAKDVAAVRAMVDELKAEVPSAKDVPDMRLVLDCVTRIFNVPVALLIEASRWKWAEPESEASRTLLRASTIVALYCSLANKARSFGLTVGTKCEVPLPIGTKF